MKQYKLLELVRVGIHGQDGTVITEDMLNDVVVTFVDQVPVVIGHPTDGSKPAVGYVESVILSEDKQSVLGMVWFSDDMWEQYKEGRFQQWSSGLRKKGADNKWYLHHLAMPGDMPPKKKGLSGDNLVEMTDKEKEVVLMLSDKPQDPETTGDQESPDQKHEEEKTMAEEKQPNPPGPDKRDERIKELEVQLAKQEKKLEAARQEVSKSEKAMKTKAVKDLVDAAAGKVPEDKLGLLKTVAAALPVKEEIDLADSAGNKEKVSPITALTRIFAAMAKPVIEGALDMGDSESKGKETINLSDEIMAEM